MLLRQILKIGAEKNFYCSTSEALKEKRSGVNSLEDRVAI